MQPFLFFLAILLYAALVLHTPPRNACEVLGEMTRYPKSTLPKLIHLQWHSTEFAPDSMQAEVYAAYKALFPDATIILWTDVKMRDFISTQYPGYLAMFDGYGENIQRIDATRYFILHHHGGLYADLDYMPFDNFWELLDPTYVSLVQSPIAFAETIQNSLMASPPRHGFWLHVFDRLLERATVTDIRLSSGTAFLSEVAAEHPEDITTLPCEVFMRLSPMRWTDNDVVTGFLYKYIFYFTPLMRACGAFDVNDKCMVAGHYGTNTWARLRVP